MLMLSKEKEKTTYTFITAAVLPDGNGGFTPCPELLTENETIRYLRLDVDGSPDPVRTLTYYRNNGQLIAIRVGRKNRYRRQDLEKFLAEKSKEKSQHSA